MANHNPSPETRFTEGNTDGVQFTEGNQARVVHGGAGALARISKGLPFIGYAREVYLDVLAELGADLDRLSGVDRVLVQRAARFEAAARMFDEAALGAAQEGNVRKWEEYNQRGGWIGGKAFHALGELRDILAGPDALLDAAILAAEVDSGDN